MLEDLPTFLVERYVAGLDEAVAGGIGASLSTAAAELRREGVRVEWVRSLALVGEETCLCIFRASRIDDVRSVNGRARLAYDHIVQVVAVEP